MLQPVNRLPPEIISHFARCLIGDDTSTRSIIPLTHVCRYWRESITSAPGNWTSISSISTKLTALSLKRSRLAPLRLKLSMEHIRRYPKFRDLLTPHVQNAIEVLHFCDLPSGRDFTQTFPDFPQSLPNLRTLELVSSGESKHRWDSSTDPFGSLPPTLRHLSLTNIPLYPSFLKLETLTKLTLEYLYIHPSPLDTILDLLEENRSLESVDINILSKKLPVGTSQRQTVIANQLQHLSIVCPDAMATRTIISNASLKRGAHLKIDFCGEDTEPALNKILFDVSLAHLSNLPSPTFMEYNSSPRAVRLAGPNGHFSYKHHLYARIPFVEFPVLPLTKVRELRLAHTGLPVALNPSSFPALETLTIQYNGNISDLFSTLFPNPSIFPSLKTLGFLNCAITDGFMAGLARFASDRKKTTSAWLHRVLIVHWDGKVPSNGLIRRLGDNVMIVDVRIGDKLPDDLT